MAQLKDLLVNGASRLIGDAYVNKIQITAISAPTSAGGTTYGLGTNGYVLKSNGSSIYWGSDTNSDTLVKQTAKSDDVNYKLLATPSASPTSGNAAEAIYDANITVNPSTHTITVSKLAGVTSITTTSGNGLVAYKPSSWTGVTSSQWGIGTIDIQGVIRSSNSDLLHSRNGTNSVILDAGNYTTYTVQKNGTGATGTWGIDISGNAATASAIALSGVTGADDIKAIEALTGTSGLLKKTAANTWTLDTTAYTTNTGTVTKVTAGTGLSIGTTAGGNFTTTGTINHTNSVTAQTTQALYPVKIDACGHISAYGSAVTSLPASDVYAWAKASTKPSYTASEVGLGNVSNNTNLNSTTGAKGDIIYWSAANTPAHLTIASSTTKKFLSVTSQALSWVTLASSDVGLGNVENKSSATIRGELTSSNVTTALGFTPYNSTNPNNYTAVQIVRW